MDLTKAPPLSVPANPLGGRPAPPSSPDAPPSPDAPAPGLRAPSLVDRVDIQPLDLAAALQILEAEVRAGLDLPADLLRMQSPAQAAHRLIQMLLQALPEGSEELPSWTGEVQRIEADFLASLDRAVDTVAAWRSAPRPVVEAAAETRSLVLRCFSEEPEGQTWPRAEWQNLAPQIERFWRRRRRARGLLTDPDFRGGCEADDDADHGSNAGAEDADELPSR